MPEEPSFSKVAAHSITFSVLHGPQIPPGGRRGISDRFTAILGRVLLHKLHLQFRSLFHPRVYRDIDDYIWKYNKPTLATIGILGILIWIGTGHVKVFFARHLFI